MTKVVIGLGQEASALDGRLTALQREAVNQGDRIVPVVPTGSPSTPQAGLVVVVVVVVAGTVGGPGALHGHGLDLPESPIGLV